MEYSKLYDVISSLHARPVSMLMQTMNGIREGNPGIEIYLHDQYGAQEYCNNSIMGLLADEDFLFSKKVQVTVASKNHYSLDELMVFADMVGAVFEDKV